jgi:hypothetical protein
MAIGLDSLETHRTDCVVENCAFELSYSSQFKEARAAIKSPFPVSSDLDPAGDAPEIVLSVLAGRCFVAGYEAGRPGPCAEFPEDQNLTESIASGLRRMEERRDAMDMMIEFCGWYLSNCSVVEEALTELRKIAPFPTDWSDPEDTEITLSVLAGRCFVAGSEAALQATIDGEVKAVLRRSFDQGGAA